jgi:hypothetical protein
MTAELQAEEMLLCNYTPSIDDSYEYHFFKFMERLPTILKIAEKYFKKIKLWSYVNPM